MKNAQISNMSYSIHSFMTEAMGLGGGELLIYAIIYSFSKGEKGIFYGSQNYLAKASGLSTSTVKRAMSSLLEKGYIKKTSMAEEEGYSAVMPVGALSDKLEAEGPPNDAERTVYEPDSDDYEDSFEYQLGSRVKNPKYKFHPVSKEGLVFMTAEQYDRLLKLVGQTDLIGYISKLESMMIKQGYRTFSPYKTIKKWIFEDAAV